MGFSPLYVNTTRVRIRPLSASPPHGVARRGGRAGIRRTTPPSSGRHRVWVSKVVGNYPCHDLYHIRARPDGTYMGPQVLIDHNVLHKVVKFEVASRRPVAETLLGTP